MSAGQESRFSDEGKPNLAPGAVTARRGPRDARRRSGRVSGRATPSLRHPRCGILILFVAPFSP